MLQIIICTGFLKSFRLDKNICIINVGIAQYNNQLNGRLVKKNLNVYEIFSKFIFIRIFSLIYKDNKKKSDIQKK